MLNYFNTMSDMKSNVIKWRENAEKAVYFQMSENLPNEKVKIILSMYFAMHDEKCGRH